MKLITLDNYKEILGSDTSNYNWSNMSEYQKLSEPFIREFQDDVDWDNISKYQTLSEPFMREFKDRFNWYGISKYQKLSEDFIREFSKKLDWYYISYCQQLSEPFIIEFQNELDWYYISKYQTLSEDFIKEFKEKIYLDTLTMNSSFYCGKHNRCIYISRSEPSIINIGCFEGTKEEAIEAISNKYRGTEKDDYISKVEECFNF